MVFNNITYADSAKVAVMYVERFLLHDTEPNHPENPERLISVVNDLKNNNQILSQIFFTTLDFNP